jgi:hypothetical protein
LRLLAGVGKIVGVIEVKRYRRVQWPAVAVLGSDEQPEADVGLEPKAFPSRVGGQRIGLGITDSTAAVSNHLFELFSSVYVFEEKRFEPSGLAGEIVESGQRTIRRLLIGVAVEMVDSVEVLAACEDAQC